jgi:hypothetical protein
MHIVGFRRLLLAVVLTTSTALATLSCIAATPAPVGRRAVWSAHDLIIRLEHLPKVYSCDDLWYKFRDVLLAIGARPDLKVLAYQCGLKLGSLAFSPKVHLYFFIPEAFGRTRARHPELHAVPQTVRLTPGHPPSITAADCELLRQMKDGLLSVLPDRVLSFNLACGAPPTRWPFNVSVEALTSVEGEGRVAAGNVPETKPDRLSAP